MGSIGEMAADGGFTGPTAWSLVDYKGQPGFRGRAFFTPEQIHANIEEGHKLGWQFGIHAIGDAAIAMTVDALDKVLHDYPRNDHRHYLCHFTVLPPERTMGPDGEGQDPHRPAAELHLQPGGPLCGDVGRQASDDEQRADDAHQEIGHLHGLRQRQSAHRPDGGVVRGGDSQGRERQGLRCRAKL